MGTNGLNIKRHKSKGNLNQGSQMQMKTKWSTGFPDKKISSLLKLSDCQKLRSRCPGEGRQVQRVLLQQVRKEDRQKL